MNQVNHIQVLFSLMTLNMILLGSLFNTFEKYIPSVIQQFFRYGKYQYQGSPTLVKKIEVPKSWFKHFYIQSSILTSVAFASLVLVYLFHFIVPQIIVDFLCVIRGDEKSVYVNSVSVLLAVALLTLQCWRRFYDTHYVSVFSKEAKINLAHYVVGHVHYVGTVFAILIEAPKFIENKLNENDFHWSDITYSQFGACALFLWSWWHQQKCTAILGNLRKDKKGTVITQKYALPHGDWFRYVSSPHNLAEILMYFSLTIILWRNITWLYVFGWVLVNQVQTALMTHWWYKEKFTDLPKERKIIIPFIY